MEVVIRKQNLLQHIRVDKEAREIMFDENGIRTENN